jgi:hypothetical protein
MAGRVLRRVLVVSATVSLVAGGAAGSGGSPAAAGAVAPSGVRSRPVPPLRRSAGVDRADPPSPGRAGPSLPSNPPPTGTWQPLGPGAIGPSFLSGGGFYGGVNSGRVTGLAVIPSGAHVGRVVAGTAGGGLWTSDDNGTTWAPRSDNAPSLAIGAVADDPSSPDHLIAGTGEGNQSGDSYPGFGVMASTDGGTSWSVQDPGGVFDGRHVSQVAIDPSNSAHMFAATDGGLFVTSNGGTSWALPTDASYAGVNGNITAVVVKPTKPSVVYIGGGAATVAKSTDGGVHWGVANSGIGAPGGAPLVALAVADSNPNTLFVSVGSTGPVAVYKTTNGGSSWSSLAGTPDYTGQAYSYGSGSGEQGWYDDVLTVDPTNANHVLAGGITAIETTNGGTSWTNVNSHAFFGGGTNLIHPDHHALAFRPDGKVWLGNDGGVYLYDPAGPTVTNANGNLNVTQFYFGFNEVGGTLLAGSQDNASARTANSSLSAWTGILAGDGGPSAVTPNNTALQFIEADGDLYRTTDAFVGSLTDITPLHHGSLFTPPMTVVANTTDPSRPTVFYGGADLYRTTNPSAASPTWTQVTSIGNFVTALAVSPSNPQVVYVGFEGGPVEVSTDGGVSFTSLAIQPFSEGFITGLSVDPTNPKVITASVSTNDTRFFPGFPHVAQYAYTTTPGTGSWTVITGNLPNVAVSRVVYDNGALIAATDAGVYGTGVASGGTTSWSPVGTGLPAAQVQDLFVDPTTSDLYAVTHGRGAWTLAPFAQVVPLSGPANTSVNISGGGFAHGETVNVTYNTGLASPASVVLCTATALVDGAWTCSGHIPAKPTAGAKGAHKIVARGQTSVRKAKTTFTRT